MTSGIIALGESHRETYDQRSFVTDHSLLGHPLLGMEKLSDLIQRLPKDQVFFSSGSVDRDADFDRASIEHKPRFDLADALKDFANADSYIMVRSPETDPEYQPLFREILASVKECTGGLDPEIRDPMLYLFVSSPNSTTPFHVDRYTTFLMQLQGTKTLYVWDAKDRETVSEEAMEILFADRSQRSPLLPKHREGAAREHLLTPGKALHIPFLAPHWVKNGDEVSISLSIIYRTRRTDRLKNAYVFNHRLRKRLGLRPHPVGYTPWRDAGKDLAERAYDRLRRLV